MTNSSVFTLRLFFFYSETKDFVTHPRMHDDPRNSHKQILVENESESLA